MYFPLQTGVLILYSFPALSELYSRNIKPYSLPIVIPLTQVLFQLASSLPLNNSPLSEGCPDWKCLQRCHSGSREIFQYLQTL